MKASKKGIALVREPERVVIETANWAEILLFLSKRGWQLSFPGHHLFGNIEVSDVDAEKLRLAGQAVLDEALHDPLCFFPVSIDLATLARIVEFVGKGGFHLCP